MSERDETRHPTEMPVDSKEGIAYLIRWAKAHGAVLDRWHEGIAKKHGVPLDGVFISRHIPLR